MLPSLLTWCITLFDLWMLKNPCIPDVNPTLSCWIIFLIYCWVWISSILLRNFASMFTSDISLQFSSFVVSLYLGIFVSWYQGDGWTHNFGSLASSVDCGFLSGGCRTVVLLASSLWPLMDEAKRLVQTSWWEGLEVGKTGSPLVGRWCSVKLESNCLLMGGAVHPPC